MEDETIEGGEEEDIAVRAGAARGEVNSESVDDDDDDDDDDAIQNTRVRA